MAALGRPPRSSIVSDSDLGFNLLQDWNNWLPFTSHRDFYSKEGASENFVSGTDFLYHLDLGGPARADKIRLEQAAAYVPENTRFIQYVEEQVDMSRAKIAQLEAKL
ncbi:uncharacterized protein LOC124649038 isoform X1 [Lolium rigidum]|uniref:uncharacterized protein LOC124649038 isoform X1 n=1 Tax=Lolium rigidum TaxID=89674 RepID=UPI001F5C697F|nr:uncharacterized protein LOC124649038 isoform X1 [Lolium rigidum]XP_051228265.1 uncharacterized protein LOC127345782 isoform X1 [Lolium perenne]